MKKKKKEVNILMCLFIKREGKREKEKTLNFSLCIILLNPFSPDNRKKKKLFSLFL
jgi:hypothetical protein